MEKFGYPASLVREYDNWAVLLRPKQATLGALVLVCKENVTAFPDISEAAFAALKTITADIENVLYEIFSAEKVNYLMLMMADPHVHFHVLPRYGAAQNHDGTAFTDPGWPGPPDIGFVNETDRKTWDGLLQMLRGAWPV